MNIGSNLIYLRKLNNLTQDDLAREISVSRQTISNWESGVVIPDSVNLIEIAKLFDVSIDDLLTKDLSVNILVNSKDDTLKHPKNNKIFSFHQSKRVLLLIVFISLVFSIYYLSQKGIFHNSDISDVVVEETPQISEIDFSNRLSAGRYFSVLLDEDGIIHGYGENDYGQLNFASWENLVEVSAGGYHTLGLSSNGTVYATGYNESGQLNVSNWSEIIQISAGRYFSLGLKANGSVVCAGENKYSQCEVSNWNDIVQISAGRYNSYGLKSDGTVVSTDDNEYGQADVTNWIDIIEIEAGTYHVLGLKSDGTVVCAGGQSGDSVCDVSDWSNIDHIVGASYSSIGLKTDGTVVAVGSNGYGQINVDNWSNIIAISAGRLHTIGIDKDFNIYAIGSNEYGQLSISNDYSQTQSNSNTISSSTQNNESDSSKELEDDVISNEQETEEIFDEIDSVKTTLSYVDSNFKKLVLEVRDESSTITKAIYNPLDFMLSLKGTENEYLLGLKCGDNVVVYRQEFELSNNAFAIDIDLSNYIINGCYYKDVEFIIADLLGYNDNRDKMISNWLPVDGKYLYKSDFDKLYLEKSKQNVDSLFRFSSNIPGRIDISELSDAADIKDEIVDTGLYKTYTSNKAISIKDILSTYNTNYINTIIPNNYDVEKTFYICNSVKSQLDSSKMLTKCIPFKLDSIRYGIMDATPTDDEDDLIKFTQEWMVYKNDCKFKILIEIPDLDYVTEVERFVCGMGAIGIPIVLEIQQNSTIEFSDDDPDIVTIYVTVHKSTNGKYLESLPLKYTVEAKTEDLKPINE